MTQEQTAAEVITTSVDDEVKSLEEQLAAIQAQMADKRKAQEEERAAVREVKVNEVLAVIRDDLRELISDEVLDALEAVGAIGVQVSREKDAEGGPPLTSTKAIMGRAKAAPRAASGGGEGKNRPLEQIFRSVATPEQVAWLEQNKTDRGADGRGARNGFMNRVVGAENPTEVPVPVARGS